jgi:hypothetical protein
MRGRGNRCVAPVPSNKMSGDVARSRSKSASVNASKPSGANPGVIVSPVSTRLCRCSSLPMRTHPGPVPVTRLDVGVCRWNFIEGVARRFGAHAIEGFASRYERA